jgi:hypothetical protein
MRVLLAGHQDESHQIEVALHAGQDTCPESRAAARANSSSGTALA